MSSRARRPRWIWIAGGGSIALVLISWAFRATRHEVIDLDAIWARAERDFKAGRHDVAESALRRLNQLRAPTPLDEFLRAQIALVHKQPDRALAALALVPDDHFMAPQARLLAGQIELRRDRARIADEFFEAALRLYPGLVQAHRERIYVLGMQERRAELSAEFRALSELSDLTAENVFHWCLLRNTSWEPREAVATLGRYVATDPLDRWSRLALADSYRRMGVHAAAESTLAALADDDPQAIAIRAQTALDYSDPDRAERLLAAGRPDDPVLAGLRGRLALARHDTESALHHFRVAYAADSGNHEAIFGLLSAMTIAGEQTAAVPLREVAGNLERLNTLIQRAVSAEARRDPRLLRELGAACAALHRDAEARVWYALAIAADPLDLESQRALYRLRDSARPGREAPGRRSRAGPSTRFSRTESGAPASRLVEGANPNERADP
jgi:predicted Zn-dependent protease